jgi:hypothetical protein
MTENVAELIEQARRRARELREEAGMFGDPVLDADAQQLVDLADALEAERAENEHLRRFDWLKRNREAEEGWRVAAEQTRLERDRAEKAEAEHDAAYAALEQEREWWETMREDHAEHLMILRDASLRRLSTVPAEALREVKARAWDEGHLRGDVDSYHGYAFGESPNPYREGADR